MIYGARRNSVLRRALVLGAGFAPILCLVVVPGCVTVSKESRFFDIRKEERLPLLMASLGTFSSVSSVVFGKTLSDAILLSARPAINIPNFFIYSSLALMVVSLIYFQLIRLLSATKLNFFILILSAFGVLFFSSLDPSSHTVIFAFATFLVTAPALGNIIVWNTISDAFNARQGRRLFNLVAAASTLGGIATGCIIPGLIHWFGIPSLPAAGCTCYILMAIPIIGLARFRRSEKTIYSTTSEARRSLREDFVHGIKNIVKSPLLKNLSIIFFLTAVATNVIDFVLKYYLQTHFDKEGIAIFYGHFNAISNTFNLIIQLTLLSQFLTRFKTRTLFAVTPIVLLIFSLPFCFVYTAICVYALRFIDVALRFVIQDSAREIATSSLPRLLRNSSKVVFKGIMNPLGGIFAGVMLNIIAPRIAPQFTPLLLIPVTFITLFFVRDLNRFSAYHLYKQLQNTLPSTTDDIIPHAENTKITYDPLMLMDDSPHVRDATIDAILLDKSEDLKTHTDIHRNALALVAHETRLAQAALVLITANTNESSAVDFNEIEPLLQSVYDDAFYRMFKGLMALYKREMIQTIFRSLSDSKSSTRAQAIELLQLTLTNCPYAKRILILCDDFSQYEKYTRLDDIEHISVEDALAIFDTENDRRLAKLKARLDDMFASPAQ